MFNLHVYIMKPFSFVLLAGVLLTGGCLNDSSVVTTKHVAPDEIAVFKSTDKNLEKTFEWARKTALSYSYSGAEPVGSWYVASLPIREAFCMRDVSHQAVGAQILGLAKHNKNMLSRIAGNIADSRDWCSFWEINRYGKPVPAVYSNDREFWYNLTANPDVLQACLQMYDWTGDRDYLYDPVFTNFYDHTVSDYVVRWDLTPERIMERRPYMNTPEHFDLDNKFHIYRGIPSYNENLPGLSVGVDLVAALCGGYEAYSKITMLQGAQGQCENAHAVAVEYRELLESKWWNSSESRYYSGLMPDGSFADSEGALYVLWFGASENAERMRCTLADIVSSEWDIQYSSYFPEVLYRHGYCDEGYDYLMRLPTMSMAKYSEVAFSFISGCVCGAMGFRPSYSDKRVETLCRLTNPREESRISNIAVYDGYMSVRHVGHTMTEIFNDTSVDLTWTASFMGDYDWVDVGAKRHFTVTHRDLKGNAVSSVEIKLAANSSLKAYAGPENK